MTAARTWLLLAPLPAIVLGAAVADTLSVPIRVFALNLLALLLGGATSLALMRASLELRARVLRWLPWLAFLALLATLVFPGIEHVHRWLSLGPIRLHASAAFLPWVLGGLASSSERARANSLALALGAQLIHLAQPDAAQATALALGLLPLLWSGTLVRRGTGLALAGVFLMLAAGSWTRADPLLAVDHVERVLVLAFSRGVLWTLAAGVAGALVFVPLILSLRRTSTAPPGFGLSVTLYFTTTLGVTFLGNFPVPVMGAGAGPVLGWYAMVTLLFALPPRVDTRGTVKAAPGV
ncbi:hypothetical protein [Vitiosangium sp. GDMCC 1.1324]|uniref:hypothetical protein n=1 Tax=Vitiosangium sp. (strain GDMCC 1.1324) TaxID=2138576 RepID=UPI000D37DF71|nr:hypothetical protein [Vitiosangium sp. GDMCC 1.1324]PTL80315.1 hypothetical protein DAT35_30490 [Vitiosangium sp. GDMCC 1.1324]